MTPGAEYLGDGRCRFTLWAPFARVAYVHLLEGGGEGGSGEGGELPLRVPLRGTTGGSENSSLVTRHSSLTMRKVAHGYHQVELDGIAPGARYRFQIDDQPPRPDPASRRQPDGVHGPSAVVDPAFPWTDQAWRGLDLHRWVLYELHVGTFTPDGTFDAIVPRLDDLRDLGVTALELMPVAQNPGTRNWGYDAVYPWAVQESYGGPDSLRRLVDACHARGLAVVLDLVYNHLGPEGNYLGTFAPYFTQRYQTPWGDALNFDGPHSDGVREYFLENARYWMREFHVDGFRFDAVHAIADQSARPFLAELNEVIHAEARERGFPCWTVAETDANVPRFVTPADRLGYGFDAQWNDDWHHALHALLTGHDVGYYADYGTVQQFERAWNEGYVYQGEYASFRERRHGAPSATLAADRFVVFATNHDQIGNPMAGSRLGRFADAGRLRLAAMALILSPFVPLLFMGEEYAEDAPFFYFIEHGDPQLVEAVRQGRREEFRGFRWTGELPDPQAESTFAQSRLRWELRMQGEHAEMLGWYRDLLALRRYDPVFRTLSKEGLTARAVPGTRALTVERKAGDEARLIVLHFAPEPADVPLPFAGPWMRMLGCEAPPRADAVARLGPWACGAYCRKPLPPSA